MADVRLPPQVKTGPGVLPLYWPQPGFRSNNDYDLCMANDLAEYDNAFDCGQLPKLAGCDLPWVTMPPSGRFIRPTSSLPISAALFDGSLQNVLSFLVPVGYDGVITMIVCNVSGANNGFVEGSGTLTWRLAANQRYLRDVGNIKFSLGSLINPDQTSGAGLRIFSGNLITFGVAFDPSGMGVLSPTAVIVCSCYGWIYPR
jgi:hypothetical protein